jgi:hypothetical protein
MAEYRFEMVMIGQGHYIKAEGIEEAKRIAQKFANEKKEVVSVQAWYPKKSKPYVIRPKNSIYEHMSDKDIVEYYEHEGMDKKAIERGMFSLKDD